MIEDIDFEWLIKDLDRKITGLVTEYQIKRIIIDNLFCQKGYLFTLDLEDSCVLKILNKLINWDILGYINENDKLFFKLWKQKKSKTYVYEGYIIEVKDDFFTARVSRNDEILIVDFHKNEVLSVQQQYIKENNPLIWYVMPKGCAIRLVVEKKITSSELKRAKRQSKEWIKMLNF